MHIEKPFLVDTGKGINIKYKNRTFYSSSEPEAGAIKKSAQINIQDKTLVFVPSPGLGYGLKELIARLPAQSHILCIEVDPILWEFCKNQQHIQSVEHEQLTLLQTAHPAKISEVLNAIGIYRFRRALLVPLCGGFGLYATVYTKLFKSIEAEIRNYWQNKITLIHMAPLWIKNLFINLHTLKDLHSPLQLNFGKPLLICGAGPSLEDSIDCIRAIRNEVKIICVDTAFPVLWQQGILPDYIFIMEAQLYNLWDFIVCINPGIPVICDLSSNPQVLRILNTEVILFCSEFYPLTLFKRMQARGILPWLIPPLGSVGIGALFLAATLKQGPVFFTGLDFSYVRNKTHSRGAPFSDHTLIHSHRLFTQETRIYGAIKKRPLLKTTGKDHKPLYTDLVLKSYADRAMELLSNNRQVYDIAGSGLELGAEKITSVDAIRQLIRESTGRLSSVSGAASGCTPLTSHAGVPCPTPVTRNDAVPWSTTGQKVKAFLQEERSLLEQTAQAVQQILAQQVPLSAENKEQFISRLKEIDYVYLHFPDPVPMPSLEEHVLLRILISIKHYLTIMERY